MVRIRAVLPLLVGSVALSSILDCRRGVAPGSPLDASAPRPVLLTHFLETRSADAPPPPPPDLRVGVVAGQGPRAGGVPEALNVADDCSVHAVWWIAHLCGLNATGDANWVAAEGIAGWVFTSAKLTGTARTDCPARLTRFETVVTGLPPGTYRFGTVRKYQEFVVHCSTRGPSPGPRK